MEILGMPTPVFGKLYYNALPASPSPFASAAKKLSPLRYIKYNKSK
jgi:hypothetical protein